MSVDHQRLNLTNRNRHLGLLPEHLGDVDGGNRSVVGKIQGLSSRAYKRLDQIFGVKFSC